PWIISRHKLAFVIFVPMDVDQMHGLEVTGVVAFELRGGGEIDARVAAEHRRRFLLTVVELIDFWPLRPWIIRGAIHRWLGQDFHLHEALAAMTHRGADAVSARIAAADDHDVQAGG